MDETEYLLNSEKNKEALMRSIEQARGFKDDVQAVENPVVDIDYIVSLIGDLSKRELMYLKDVCKLYIKHM